MAQHAHNADTPRQLDDDQIAATVVEVVKRLVYELKSHQPLERITLDSSLDRDVGLDSLARVELLNRLEDRFGIALPERIYIEAETPRDLLRAAKQARISTYRVSALTMPVDLTSAKEPLQAQTLVDVLQWHNKTHPQRPHIRMYGDEGEGAVFTYKDLFKGAERIAAGLQHYGVQHGQSVALMLQAGEGYFYSFFGILLAGCVPVPIYPPARLSQLEDHIRRHCGILQNCLATALITMPEAKAVAKLLKAHVQPLRTVITVAELSAKTGTFSLPAINPEDTAFLQYTSGSTGNPKGVILTHANILANIRAMGERIHANSNDVFVSWLPLYHDMGLIGAWFGSMYYSMLFVVMSPLAFLTRPQRWLWAIHRYRGTLAASPNFGYEFCLNRVEERDLQGLNLSSWRAAFNGAEAVSPETVEQFCKCFYRYGFQRNSFMPVYGLAENSVGLAFPSIDRGPLIDRIKRDPYMRDGTAMPAEASDKNAIRFAACGSPLSNHQVRVVDAANQELPERQEGQLQFRGPSATSGYFRNPEQTTLLFSDGWLNSGDLAYIAGGDIYLTGRAKDIIIKAGRNLYPDELEEAVGNLDDIRKGRVAVFGSKHPDTGTERLVILAETRENNTEKLTEIRSQVNALTSDLIGSLPDDIVLAPPNTVLKTSSGKIRRAASREVYERGQVGKTPKALWWQILRVATSGVLPQIRRSRQLLSRVAFGLYARTLFWIIAPTVWLLIAILPSARHRWEIMRKGTRLLAKGSLTPIFVHGEEKLPPPEKPCIYVTNHGSYLDGPLLVTLLGRRFSFIAKSELLQSFVSRIFLRRIDTEFVERFDIEKGVADTERLEDIAKAGKSLLFFPEGTFTRAPGLLPFHMGAFIVAANANLPIVPIIIRGTRSIFRAGSWLPSHGKVTLHILEPIEAKGKDKAKTADIWRAALELRNKTRKVMLKQCSEPDLASD